MRSNVNYSKLSYTDLHMLHIDSILLVVIDAAAIVIERRKPRHHYRGARLSTSAGMTHDCLPKVLHQKPNIRGPKAKPEREERNRLPLERE